MQAVVLIDTVGTHNEPWVVLVAALTSGALGAIVGGYLTVRVRGRIEREEAWRARLIEAADELTKVLVAALNREGNLLTLASRGDRQLFGRHMKVRSETEETLNWIGDRLREAWVALGRVELLFTEDSKAYEHGVQTIKLIGKAVALVRGLTAPQALVKAALAERRASGSGIGLLVDPRDSKDMMALLARPTLPDAFDPRDNLNVIRWALEIHEAASENAHEYMRAARGQIERYRSFQSWPSR